MNQYKQDQREREAAYRIRHLLNQSAENLPQATLDKLATARRQAITRKKPEGSRVPVLSPVIVGSSGFTFQGPINWFGKFGVVLPLLILVAGLFGIHEYEQQRRIKELADIDTAVLVDELPPDAYLDKGFSTYLNDAQGE